MTRAPPLHVPGTSFPTAPLLQRRPSSLNRSARFHAKLRPGHILPPYQYSPSGFVAVAPKGRISKRDRAEGRSECERAPSPSLSASGPSCVLDFFGFQDNPGFKTTQPWGVGARGVVRKETFLAGAPGNVEGSTRACSQVESLALREIFEHNLNSPSMGRHPKSPDRALVNQNVGRG